MPGTLHVARRQGVAVGDALDLGDHDAVRVLGGHRHREIVEGERLLLHGDIAHGVGGGAADERDRHRRDLVEQPFVAFELDQLDDVARGDLVDAAALVPRVDEGVQADLGERAGLAACEIAEQLGDDALRQIVGVDFFIERQLAHRGHASPIAGHHFAQQSLVAETAQAFGLAVALAGGGEQAQIARRAGLEIAALERLEQRFRHAGLNEAAARQRVAVTHQADGLVGGDDLVSHGVTLPELRRCGRAPTEARATRRDFNA